jgi:hypothetical protein
MNPNSIDAGLLRFCLKHSDGGNLTETQLPQRDEADYAWLRAALNDLQTDVDRMKKLVEMLRSPESSITDKATALEELQYLIEDIDNANGTHYNDASFISLHKFNFFDFGSFAPPPSATRCAFQICSRLEALSRCWRW